MTVAPKDPASPARDVPPGQAARERRLAEALRENLKRRKAQSRGRRDAGDGPPPDATKEGTA